MPPLYAVPAERPNREPGRCFVDDAHELDMQHIETVIISLLVAVAVLGATATRIGVPYPILLVLGGLVLGFLPGMPSVHLDPDLVLVVFLPPLLYAGAFFANLRELRADARAITLLSTVLVLITAAAVAVAMHALVDGLPWAACFALGAIVAPTDPVAATAIARRLNVPRRTINILEGESLVNDASALVAYRIAVGAIGGGTFSLLDAGFQFVAGAAGGVAIGLVVARVIAELRRRLDDPPVEITLSLLSGYAAYVPADQIGASGVVAAVTAGIALGWWAPGIASPLVRQQGFALWTLLTFLLNAVLFILIGLQLPSILDGLSGESPAFLLEIAAVVCLVVIGTRIAWYFTMPFVIRALDRRQSQRARRAGWRIRMVSAWAGMRGAVSLAAALALPGDTPQRDLLVFLTFAVILATLVLQGLSLPWVIRRLRLPSDDGESREELRARLTATRAALDRIDELAAEDWTRDDTAERMAALYQYRQRRLKARAGKIEDDGYEDRSAAYQRMVHEVLEAQRQAIVRLRNEGEISNDVMHRIERELDLEDQRLEI
jgi:CPA1 family monovalent cation:H+ antiporter